MGVYIIAHAPTNPEPQSAQDAHAPPGSSSEENVALVYSRRTVTTSCQIVPPHILSAHSDTSPSSASE